MIATSIVASCASGPPASSDPPSASSTGGGAAGAGTTSSPAPAGSLRIALVTDSGGRNDGSSNSAAEDAVRRTAGELRAAYEVAESNRDIDYVPNLTRFAQGNYDLIVAVGIQMSAAVAEVAKTYPEVRFALVDSPLFGGDPPKPVSAANVAELRLADHYGGYLLGIAAAEHLKTRSASGAVATVCTLGDEGALLPSELAIAGFQDAVRTTIPSVRILASWSDYGAADPEADGLAMGKRDAARGCDVFFAYSGNAGIGYLKAAAAAGKASLFMVPINYVLHDNFVVPGGRAANVPSNVLAYYLRSYYVAIGAVATEIANHSFKSGPRFTWSSDTLLLGPAAGAAAPAIKAAVATATADISAGRIQPKSALLVR